LVEGAAHCRDPAHLIDGWTDDRKIEALLAADISVEHFAHVKGQIHTGGRQAFFLPFAICDRDRVTRRNCAGQCRLANATPLFSSKYSEDAVAHQFQYVASLLMYARYDRIGIIIEQGNNFFGSRVVGDSCEVTKIAKPQTCVDLICNPARYAAFEHPPPRSATEIGLD